jgi:hypothetical protein
MRTNTTKSNKYAAPCAMTDVDIPETMRGPWQAAVVRAWGYDIPEGVEPMIDRTQGEAWVSEDEGDYRPIQKFGHTSHVIFWEMWAVWPLIVTEDLRRWANRAIRSMNRRGVPTSGITWMCHEWSPPVTEVDT